MVIVNFEAEMAKISSHSSFSALLQLHRKFGETSTCSSSQNEQINFAKYSSKNKKKLLMAIFFIKLNHFKILTLKIGIFLKNIKQTSIKLEFTSKM